MNEKHAPIGGVLSRIAASLCCVAPSCEPATPCAEGETLRRQRLIFWLVAIPLLGLVGFPRYAPLFYLGTTMKLHAFSLFVTLSLAAGEVCAVPRTVALDVRNMNCPVCPITVRKALEQVSGVKKVTVDFERKTATVEFDDAAATNEKLTETTKAAGYPSSIRESRP